MKHLTEEQIVLHFYGDAEDAGEVLRHLGACAECRAELARVSALLKQIGPLEVPEPFASFEQKTWLNLRERLSEGRKSPWQRLLAAPKWALAGVMVLIVAGAFLAGRFWPRHDVTAARKAPGNPERVVLVAVGDHLERSQVLLVEIMNADAKGAVDLSTEQRQARDLLDANHLYRVSAQQAGDPAIAGVLDDLGRVLTEIANGPSERSPAELQEVRGRIQSQGLLFKIRVLGSEVGSKVRQQEPAARNNTNWRL